ncbi:hypothetical protein [Flammeovirga sp. SJP92]|uniref:hypothetical protein n=1 Tax=Flammeovirga sp. SJP92 TaxID=1775430 RepID=UPI000793B4DD|nr:hypothetical protein [Flammeovirga sp. SJP92]KXX69236.1 hypothetical protein AVL50_16370 [Flammeovirga sp. SJP92]
MSQLKCKCGNVLSDVSDSLPYKGEIIPDRAFYNFLDKVENFIETLIEATNSGKRIEWIRKHFSSLSYPEDLDDTQMLCDIHGNYYSKIKKDIYQCDKCNRLWIQQNNTETFISFVPESDGDEWSNVLLPSST